MLSPWPNGLFSRSRYTKYKSLCRAFTITSTIPYSTVQYKAGNKIWWMDDTTIWFVVKMSVVASDQWYKNNPGFMEGQLVCRIEMVADPVMRQPYGALQLHKTQHPTLESVPLSSEEGFSGKKKKKKLCIKRPWIPGTVWRSAPSCACIPTTGQQPRSLPSLFYGDISAVSTKKKIASLCGQAVNRLQPSQKWSLLFRLSRQLCPDIIHCNVGICAALLRRWAAAATVLWAANRSDAKQRLTANCSLGMWGRNPGFITAVWVLFHHHFRSTKAVLSFIAPALSQAH